MNNTNELVVIPLGELIAQIEGVLERFLGQENSPYNSRRDDDFKVYTRKEVAALLKKSPNTVTKYIRQKKLVASVFNRQYYISHKELMKFINRNKNG